ncbi:MAG TPA: hypothetical protein VLA19_20800 [Herpetosiphonaceae bacterium]|nr:hypothetical protein [Herpetosiphonaceae bacterium]
MTRTFTEPLDLRRNLGLVRERLAPVGFSGLLPLDPRLPADLLAVPLEQRWQHASGLSR